MDGHFDVEKCKELYEVWIDRDFQEKDYYLWVWDENNQPIAYTSARLDPNFKSGLLGLVGVHENFQGKGIGVKLQNWILLRLKELGAEHVEVVTQGRNINGQYLYQKSGYRLKSIDLWYHKWF